MGRWWRVQAYFTDIVTVGLALPAYIWVLLGVMWFGFGFRAPLLRGGVGHPRADRPCPAGDARHPTRAPRHVGAYDVPFRSQVRHLILALDVRRVDRGLPPGDHRHLGMRRAGRVVRQQRGRGLPRALLVRDNEQTTTG